MSKSDDTISRQAAINRFCELGTELERQNKLMMTMVDAKYTFIKTIESLPSADRPTVDKEYLIDLIQEAVYDGEACAKLIDLVDRPTGEWTEDGVCSNCGGSSGTQFDGIQPIPLKTKFCPDCGAKMRGDDSE